MNRRITDARVAGLPIGEGRAELLEEIMATTALESTATSYDDARPPRRNRWLPALAAAAAVVAVVGGGVWIGDQRGDVALVDPPAASAPGDGEVAVLDAPGWTAQDASIDEAGGELSYEKGAATLEVHWRPRSLYDDYVRDRDDIGPSEEVRLLGRPALLWAYSADDHTVIREVVGDFTLEVRGSGMPKQAYLRLLGQLVAVAPGELDAHLPDGFVTDAERADVVADMLAPIPVPDGFDRAIESDEVDRYQLGADVTRAVTCTWIDVYAAAARSGDARSRAGAVEAMATSRGWPVLREMTAEGEWSQVIWQIADRMRAGQPVHEEKPGIGCED